MKVIDPSTRSKDLAIALEKYKKRQVSLWKAASIAGIPLADMIQIAAKNKIPISYTKEDLIEDFKAVQ